MFSSLSIMQFNIQNRSRSACASQYEQNYLLHGGGEKSNATATLDTIYRNLISLIQSPVVVARQRICPFAFYRLVFVLIYIRCLHSVIQSHFKFSGSLLLSLEMGKYFLQIFFLNQRNSNIDPIEVLLTACVNLKLKICDLNNLLVRKLEYKFCILCRLVIFSLIITYSYVVAI